MPRTMTSARTLLPSLPALLLILSALAAPLAGQSGSAGARYERTVQPGAAGPNRLDPDVALLTGAGRDLASLRIHDGNGREVPYLLVPPVRREPDWRGGQLLRIPASKAASGFEVDLGAVTSVDRLRLEGIPTPFLKRYRLEGGGDRSRWTVLVDQGTLFDLPEQGLRATDIAFAAGDYRYLRLTWDDRTSAVAGLPSAVSARVARVADPLAAVMAPVQFRRRESEPGKSRFHLRLPGPGLPVVALVVEAAGGNLLRPATLTQGRLGNGVVTPVEVGGGTLRRALRGDLVAADLRLPVNALEGPELDLTVEDGDNPLLELTGIRAELAPLPWIYFEVSAPGPLTARYGDPRARAPRYDLEAVREGLVKVRPAAARWGETRGSVPPGATDSAAEGGALPTLGAPLEVSSFRHRRPVPAPAIPPAGGDPASGKKGSARPVLTSLLLDAEVLAKSADRSDLDDLRLADEKGRQIPYLVDRRSEPLALPLGALAKVEGGAGTPGVSRYRVELPYEALPDARLVLATRARVFERNVRLIRLPAERPVDRRRGQEYEQTVAEASWRHADPETEAPKLVLQVPADGAGKLELRIEDGDNAPLPLEAATLLLPAVRLRFFHPGSEVQLVYGRPDLDAPRYDLALLGPQLLGAAAEEVSLAPAGAGGAEAADTEKLPRLAFWGVLGLAVVVLLVVLARLLREKG